MTDGLQHYPEYKDSGVEWLGDIPAHWDTLPLRAITKVKVERNRPELSLLSVYRDYGVILRNSRDDNYNPQGKDLNTYKVVAPGDLVLNKMKTWQGSLGVSQYEGIVSPAYIVCGILGEINPQFLHILLRSRTYIGYYNQISYGVRVNQWDMRYQDFKQVPVLFPPPEEQAAIVRYLDHADRRIRRYIAAKRKQIALLNEQKQAIIQQAVTRGLDSNVQLKPSSVGWLGDIPEHWNVSSVRRLITYITSGSRGWAEFYSDDGDLFIQSGNLGRSMALDLRRVHRVQVPLGSEGQRTRIALSDILVCVTGALTGNVAIVTDNPPVAYINQHVALLRPRTHSVVPRFLAYALYSKYAQAQFKLSEYGGTKQGLGLDDVRNVLVIVPDKEEQERIVAVLDSQTKYIIEAIDKVSREIDIMREYRTRLIADVAKGKLDVRDAALSIPDDSDWNSVADTETLQDELEPELDSEIEARAETEVE